MLQRDPRRIQGPKPRGAEAWLLPLVVGITNLALSVALGWFLVIVYPLRDRIAMPKATIPAAMALAAGLILLTLWRGYRSLRTAWSARRSPGDAIPPRPPR